MGGKPLFIRGETPAHWAQVLGISRLRVYQMHREGTLESRIDGTWKPTQRERVRFGKTYKEWAKHIGKSVQVVAQWDRLGDLELVANGKPRPDRRAEQGRKRQKVYGGKTTTEIMEMFGVTRQRVQQLAASGVLEMRLSGVDPFEYWRQNVLKKNDAKFLPIYSPTKTINQMAEEAGVNINVMSAWLRSRGKKYKKRSVGAPRKRDDLMQSVYSKSRTVNQMAELSGIDRNLVHSWLKYNGLDYKREKVGRKRCKATATR